MIPRALLSPPPPPPPSTYHVPRARVLRREHTMRPDRCENVLRHVIVGCRHNRVPRRRVISAIHTISPPTVHVSTRLCTSHYAMTSHCCAPMSGLRAARAVLAKLPAAWCISILIHIVYCSCRSSSVRIIAACAVPRPIILGERLYAAQKAVSCPRSAPAR